MLRCHQQICQWCQTDLECDLKAVSLGAVLLHLIVAPNLLELLRLQTICSNGVASAHARSAAATCRPNFDYLLSFPLAEMVPNSAEFIGDLAQSNTGATPKKFTRTLDLLIDFLPEEDHRYWLWTNKVDLDFSM
jgi:hypothetical protein